MRNETLRKRLIQAMAISYAVSVDKLLQVYQKVENLEKLLNLLETNELEKFLQQNN